MFLEKKLSQTQNQSIKNRKACKWNYKCLYFQAEYKTRVFYKLKYISYPSVWAVVVAQVVVHQSTDREVRVRFPLPLGAGLFSLSSLSYISISGESVIRSHVEVQHYWFSTFKENRSLAVKLEAKQA